MWMNYFPEMRPYQQELSFCAHQKEQDSFIKEDYMSRSKNLNERMREKLVSWMVEIQSHLNTKQETLFLAIFILDKVC